MLVECVVFDVRPFGQLALADRANVAVFFASMLLHVQKSVAFEVADLTFELNDAGMDAFMGCDLQKSSAALLQMITKSTYRCLASEQLLAKVAVIKFVYK